MKNKKTIYHFIIDKSSSMYGMRMHAVEGFNTQLKTLQELKKTYPEQEFHVSLTYFNELVRNEITNGNVEQLVPMEYKSFLPSGSTALLDAIGKSIYQIKSDFGPQLLSDEATAVVVIITDGEENSSRFYTYHEIARMVKELDETGKWTFSFLGADLNAVHTSQMLNIREENVISFSKSNYSNIMDDVSESIRCYATSKSEGKPKNDIFDIFDKKDRRES